MEKKAIIIGGGIHGISLAIELSKHDFEVTILEKNKDILMGTSGATQNRAHLGYHYPRSKETAFECKKGLELFKERYPEAIFYPKDAYYMLEKEGSKISSKQFKEFCKDMGLSYKLELPKEEFVNISKVQESFKVEEPVFDLKILKKKLIEELSNLNVKIKYLTEVVGFEKDNNQYRIITKEKNEEKSYSSDFIFNATYAYANNILKILNLEEDMTEYILQKTEVPVMKSKNPIPALTVMDGDFFSILPFGNNETRVLLYDVVNSVISREKGYFFKEGAQRSNIKKILEHGKKYYPFIKDLEYEYSLYGSRPIPAVITNDSRGTRINIHKKYPGIYSILEGKFISAPLIAKEILQMIKNEYK